MQAEVLPQGWRNARLGELSQLTAGGTPARSQPEYYNGSIPWLKSGEVSQGRIGATEEYITERGLAESSARIIPAGTPVVAMYGATAGAVGILEIPAAINQAVLAVRPISELLDSWFCLHLLSFKATNLVRMTQGSGQPNLSKALIQNLELHLPPLPEQRQIAEILSSVDDAIAATRAVIEQTRKVKQGVLERLLTKGIGHTRFKQTEIGEIPEGWEVVELIDVSEAVTVGIASSATHAYRASGIAMLRNQNIKAGILDLSDLLFVSPEYDAENASKRVKTGDIVSMRTGYPGRSAVIPSELDGCQTFTTLVTKPKRSLINSEFLCAWINSDGGMKQVRRLQAGGAQQNLNAGVLKKLLVPLPPLPEQQQIASSAHALLFDEEQEIGALSELKSALMSELLTGRKRVTDALPIAAE